MRVTCTCGATWMGSRVEHCTACHETFNGTTAGDLHRVGDFTDQGANQRRCLTPDEMRARGLRQNERGQWGRNLSPAAYDRLHPKNDGNDE